jgi:steroid 5-alpha reductase family enzyme
MSMPEGWWLVAAVTEGCALLAWLRTLATRQVRFTFVVGFNTILPVTLVHLSSGPFGIRSWLALVMVVVYLAGMNVVILGLTQHTAMAKLDRHMTVAERHMMPWVMTNGAGWLYCLPFYFVARGRHALGWPDVAAVLVYVIGTVIHVAADLQKHRFKKRPDSAGRILDSGLWAWSRHPNYLGDTLVYEAIRRVQAERP